MAVKLSYGLQMQQTQRLIMTPELRAAITVLQLPVTELEEYIDQQLLENPVLDTEARDEPETKPDPPAIDPAQWLDYIGDDETGYYQATNRDFSGTPEPAVAPVVTVQEHLQEQLRLASLPAAQRRIGELLIGNIDDSGYLTIAPSELAGLLGIAEHEVLRVLELVQGLEPAGVGARDLRECLRLQSALIAEADPLVGVIIDHYLDDLAAGRILRIAENLGVKPAQVQSAADRIRTLDPKPGRRFGRPGDTRYIVPDVAVERVSGEYVVIVNDGPLPRLGISRQYRAMLQAPIDEGARKFLEGKLQAALWLMKALEQRRLTISRVTESIMRFQRDFLDQGARSLVPLTLREVAAEVGLHESTVSRATAGKYVQTPQGLFELKFFFSSGVESVDGSGVAAESVKFFIGDLIAQEDPREPLSDQALAESLERQGVHISRRTVAKYREEMGVPSSPRRKRY